MDERTDGWMDERTDGWMNGRMDGWMDGWMDESFLDLNSRQRILTPESVMRVVQFRGVKFIYTVEFSNGKKNLRNNQSEK